MAKLKPDEKRVQLSFQRPEDLRLFSFMERESYRCRWEMSTFILASLTEAFKDRMEEDEVESIAAEAAQKVRERTAVAVPEPPPMPPAAPPAKPQPVSMERALNDAEAQIAALDAVAAKTMGKRVVRKGVPSPPPLPR
jgi:hypothetical protein